MIQVVVSVQLQNLVGIGMINDHWHVLGTTFRFDGYYYCYCYCYCIINYRYNTASACLEDNFGAPTHNFAAYFPPPS